MTNPNQDTPIPINNDVDILASPPEFMAIGDISDKEMAKALEGLDLSIPKDFLDQVMADDLLTNIVAVYKSETAARAARATGDGKTAEGLIKQAATCRAAAGLIQYKFPGATPLIEDLARTKINEIRTNRKKFNAAAEE